MKVTTGRGIQFFKKPVFTVPKSFAVNTFNLGKKHATNAWEAINDLPKKFNKKSKEKEKK